MLDIVGHGGTFSFFWAKTFSRLSDYILEVEKKLSIISTVLENQYLLAEGALADWILC